MSAFLPANEYLALPRDPQKWVIKDLITTSGLTNVFGAPKAGKSFACLGMAHAISQNKPDWLGFPVLKHGPVAYLQIDTPREEWAGRLLDMQALGFDISNIHVCDMLMTKSYPMNVLDPEQLRWLRESLAELKPVVVFIDTLREAHDGDENDATIMKNVVTNLVAACRPASIVFLSHARKTTAFTANGGDDLMSDNRGSSYVPGRMDVIVKFTKKTMSYKGRSIGEGIMNIRKGEGGMIEVDGKTAEYFTLLRARVTEMRAADPDITYNAMAVILHEEKLGPSKRTLNDHIKLFLEQGVELTPRLVKSRKSKQTV